ncbi:MAG: 3-methyl-2-oxobutanoate hydroxymethyltransferase [Actinomycetota bacterium]|jgi:3-methyl-2-oxobutanoate hydroxymethyltransferase|nr:3-methyl-2-oxobutanoate hydroxymethyltransferase [Actinomycetota bacterium]
MTEASLYGGIVNRRITIRDLQAAKDRGERWAMLTSYDMLTAALFEQAGITALLIGDSAGNNVLGYDTTVPVTVDDMVPMVRAVARATSRALVIADLPFGSYQASPQQAFDNAVRFMREGAQAVKLEGGRRVLPQVELLVESGIPVMGHIGLTPQSVNALGGYRVQGRGDAGDQLLKDALALERAGAFALVLEVVPSELAERITQELTIPTVGIGAGPATDAQVLVWTDMAGLTPGPGPKFLKKYADLRTVLSDAVSAYTEDVREGRYPAAEHGYS